LFKEFIESKGAREQLSTAAVISKPVTTYMAALFKADQQVDAFKSSLALPAGEDAKAKCSESVYKFISGRRGIIPPSTCSRS
jgi:hypothetical protein